jgi:hypothetical protein
VENTCLHFILPGIEWRLMALIVLPGQFASSPVERVCLQGIGRVFGNTEGRLLSVLNAQAVAYRRQLKGSGLCRGSRPVRAVSIQGGGDLQEQDEAAG